MVGGKICEKCQKATATTELNIQGWRKWTVCDDCCKELQTCSKCKINKATSLFKEKGWQMQICFECKEIYEAWERNNPTVYKHDKGIWDKLEDLKKAKAEMEPYLQKPKLIENYGKSLEHGFMVMFGIGKQVLEDNDPYCKQVRKALELTDKEKLIIAPDGKALVIEFEKEQAFRALKVLIKAYNWRINELSNKDIPNPSDKPNIPDKNNPTDNGKKPPNPNELCERCGASCIVHKTKTSYTIKRRRYIKHKVDFTRESSQWFGLNCGCIEKYKQENQQTCPQCKKTEFPDMAKGWMLDYEVKLAFCSPKCHVEYRELKWEEAQRLTQVEMMPPELDVETNPIQNTDWEKEGLRREVLFWREYAKSLEQKLKNQNLTPEERQQADYLRNLQQNTLRNAESAYRDRYGDLTEDGSDNKDKGLSGGMIFLIIIEILIIVGGIIFFLTKNKKKAK